MDENLIEKEDAAAYTSSGLVNLRQLTDSTANSFYISRDTTSNTPIEVVEIDFSDLFNKSK